MSSSSTTTSSPITPSLNVKPDIKHEHIHYHFQAGEKQFPESHPHQTHPIQREKPRDPSYAIVNYLDVESDGSSSYNYGSQGFQHRGGTIENNNNPSSTPSLVYSKVVKIEDHSPYNSQAPSFVYQDYDNSLKIGKSTDEGIELIEEDHMLKNNSKTSVPSNENKFYFPVSSQRKDGMVDTDLVTPEVGGKFIFTDVFPFFKRVSRIDDTIKTIDGTIEAIKKIDDTIEAINNVATTTERNLMIMATENTITNIKRVDKNSRRML